MNINIDKTQALLALRPNTSFTYDEETDTLTWITSGVTTPTDAEISAKISELEAAEPMRLLRQKRDRLLAETDWWVLPDRTATQAQLDYRQALRDITDSATSLDDVNWPEKP